MSGMNENKVRRFRRNEELARTFAISETEYMINKDMNKERNQRNINLLEERNRLAKAVKDLLDAGKTLDEAIEQIISENSDSPVLSKEKTVDPKQSLINWFYKNYPISKVRDDEDER